MPYAIRTHHTVSTPDGPKVEQYFAPLDCSGPAGPFLDSFELARSARKRAMAALAGNDRDRFNRELETFRAMLRRSAFWCA